MVWLLGYGAFTSTHVAKATDDGQFGTNESSVILMGVLKANQLETFL